MAVIASLNVLLKASADQFSNTMKKSTQDLGAVGAASNRLNSTLGTLKTAFAGFVTLAAANSLRSMAISTLEVVDANINLAERLGTTYNGLKALQLAADANGSSAEVMDAALQRMNITLGDAETGSASAAASLNKLGLSASILKGLSLDQQFSLIVRQINRLEDSAQRAAAVQDIFGRGASELGNLLNLTSDDFANYANEINNSAAALSATQIAELKKAQDSVEALARSWEGLKTQIVSISAPSITSTLKTLADAMELAANPSGQTNDFLETINSPYTNILDPNFVSLAQQMQNEETAAANAAAAGPSYSSAFNRVGFSLFEDVANSIGSAVVRGARVGSDEAESVLVGAGISATVQNSLRAGGIAFRSITNTLADVANQEFLARATPQAAAGIGAGTQADRLFSFNRDVRASSKNPVENLVALTQSANDLLAAIADSVSGSAPEFDL